VREEAVKQITIIILIAIIQSSITFLYYTGKSRDSSLRIETRL
jgi:hypothetical protein